jgi:ABC-type antimicrobial peptide transport system permease subunit
MTGFLVIGMSKSSSIETRFDPRTMYLLSLDPARDGYPAEKAQALFEKLPERLRTISGVDTVALAGQPPFDSELEPSQVTAEDAIGSSRVQQPITEAIVGARYFSALGEPLLAGREFTEQDQQSDASSAHSGFIPAVLSENAQRKLFGNGSAIGKHVSDDKQTYQVVGVVPDAKDVDGFSLPAMYLPLTPRNFARPAASGITVLVRSNPGRDALSGIRSEIAFMDPNLNIFNMETLAAYLDRSRASLRFSIQSWGAIGVFGLILAAVGLAGVTAYAVAQRRKEIAIRTALGASRAQVLRLVLREGAALVGVGTVVGLIGAMGVAKVVAALMNIFVDALRYGTDDPLLLVGAPLLLAAVAMLACYLPARKSAKIDPLEALRQE